LIQVIFIHKNIPGVLRKVNEVLADHNVEKQMTDSRGEVAYLMADVSNVDQKEIKDLWQNLEDLSCELFYQVHRCEHISHFSSSHSDAYIVLEGLIKKALRLEDNVQHNSASGLTLVGHKINYPQDGQEFVNFFNWGVAIIHRLDSKIYERYSL
jgi:gamma-glutamyl phosphate reductase